MRTVYDFNFKEKPPANIAGAKALKLMEMQQNNFPVPIGMVLTTDFFTPWTDTLKKSKAWANLSTDDTEALFKSAKELQLICSSLKFDEAQKKQFDEAFSLFQQKSSSTMFAVRSSSPEEDKDSASFAGGYETVLGVNTAGLEEAVKHCFTSCFDVRVFSYKKEHQISTESPRIAVIIQQQLDADCAGVGFSINPLNNCFDEAVINANFGLGESVVSGQVEPDYFVVDKLKHTILKKQIGKKQLSITLNENGGTSYHMCNNHNSACIEDRHAHAITQLIHEVEDYYQVPVDIEWALANDHLYLLQVRPITTYHPLPQEMITKPGEQKMLYANSTLIEQGVAEPLSVLGTDFLQYILKQMGGDIVGIDGMTFTAGGQYYMNLSNSIASGGMDLALAPGSSGDETVLSILDDIDLAEYRPKKLPAKVKKSRRSMVFSAIPMLKSLIRATKNPKALMQSYYKELPAKLESFTQDAQDSKTLREHAERLTSKLDFFLMKYGMPTMFGAVRAKKSIADLFQDADVSEHITNMAMALPHNKTTEMGEALYAIAASEEFRRFDSADRFLAALKSGEFSHEFVSSWQSFLEEFGARCPKEIDVATLRPKEHPAIVFDQAKALAYSMDTESEGFFDKNNKKREAAYQALRSQAQRMGRSATKQFEKNYSILYNFGGFRESGKQYIVKAADLFRQEALAKGNSFVLEGRLDSAEQVFDLTIDDIDRASADTTMELRQLAHNRTAFTNRLRKSKFLVRIIDSRGKIFMPPVKHSDDGGFLGIAISPGVVRGRAKVLHSADEKKLLPGEILVARATDPGWTPLFIYAAGIVLEIGGALQHGAVVAREYGIPCVSGITDATDFISDGQLIEVDGSNGVVRILDGEKPTYPPVSQEALNAAKEKNERKKKVKVIQKIKQTFMIIFPLFLSPFLVLFVCALLFTLVKMFMGVGALQAITDFQMFVRENMTLISLSTWLVVAIAVVFALCHNKRKIRKVIRKVLSSKQDS